MNLMLAQTDTALYFFGFSITMMIVTVALGVFTFWMFFHALTNSSLDSGAKVGWALAVFVIPVAGPLAYMLFGRKGRQAS